MKLSKSEAGRLGSKASQETQQKNKDLRIKAYLLDPKVCLCCGKRLGYQKRSNKFCDKSCAATYNNSRKAQKPRPNCLNCGKKLNLGNKFCYNNFCQFEYQYKQYIKSWKETGKFSKGPIKRYLAEKQEGCWECGITEWNGKPIVLELEHIDGNSLNNQEENLSLLCPNCHSQTDTYKGKNTGNGRHSRRMRYIEGKSY
jgi:predicted nucleic acid-binding Zn ribbon protein